MDMKINEFGNATMTGGIPENNSYEQEGYKDQVQINEACCCGYDRCPCCGRPRRNPWWDWNWPSPWTPYPWIVYTSGTVGHYQ